ncbi:MAG: DUF3152 domain-containing protein [Jatrophihabitantaceae bacterium]
MVQTDEGHEDVALARRGVATFGDSREPGGAMASLREFVRRYGWRAYALPVLVIITVVALLSASTQPAAPSRSGAGSGNNQGQPAPPVASGNTSLKADQPGSGALDTALKSAALPAGGPFTNAGAGTFRILPGASKPIGKGQLFRYSIEVENGITGIDLTQYASLVQSTLSDTRSWAGHGDVQLERVDSGAIDFHVTLTSVMTVRKICGYTIAVETSCYQAAGDTTPVNRVVFDDARWARGSAAYLGDLNAYRIYMINHEDGHAIGHEHAHACLPGGSAPVMMQQTIGLKSASTGKMCMANPWPYPSGVKGAPGIEAADTPQNSEFGLTGD